MTRRRWVARDLFPPIHPTGRQRGRDGIIRWCRSLGIRGAVCDWEPVGGGAEWRRHKDIEPALGTFEDFNWLIDELEKRGMELALDFAINCSPDHPYVHDKPEWFFKRRWDD